MKMNWRPIQRFTNYMMLVVWAVTLGVFAPWHSADAEPVDFFASLAGNFDFVATGGTLRTQPNPVDPCAVTNSGSAALSGIPATATVTAAYLYWAGSGATGDYTVTFDGSSVTADRTFTETINISGVRNFFSGFKDVTAQVAAKGNGTYTFADLTVDTGPNYCGAIPLVVSGWSLIVIYEDAAEPLRVINLWDGLQVYQASSLTLTPSNFEIPNSGIEGKHGILTWEGDSENSAPQNGFTEALIFNGTELTDGLNPLSNQFNSTINVLGSNTSYGVDLDVYDVTSLLNPGDTSATSIYSSGQDVVLLSLEILSVTNTPVADLAISKTHSGNFTVGQNGVYTLSVTNNGPSTETGTITVTDTLPTGLGYVSATGTGWTCGSVGQDVTCTHAGPLANGASLPDITLTVSVGTSAAPSITNTASVSGTTFDNQTGNNSSSDPTTVISSNLSTSTKTVVDLNSGEADAGDTLRYTITLTETGGLDATGVSVLDNLPSNTTGISIVNIPAGATNNSTPTLVDISNITVAASSSETIVFDVTVSGSANPGDTIDNTATITNPDGPGATPAAPTIIVSPSLLTGGNKQLYLAAGNTLSRVVPGFLGDVAISEAGGSASWTLSPALANALTVDGSSGQIPVTLVLGKEFGFSPPDRSFTISLSSSAIGEFASFVTPAPVDLDPPITATYNLNLTSPGDKILPVGSTITLTITNNTPDSGFGNLQILVNPNGSFVDLPSKTVINVDSVQFYDAAYPGGNVISDVVPGQAAYVRAVISDPFGAFDITSATVAMTAGPCTIALPTMTEIAPLETASTKTYESVVVNTSVPAGNTCTASVTGNEGSEGTISHTRTADITTVVASNLSTSTKTVVDLNGGEADAGDTLRYTITLTETGGLDATGVSVLDNLPSNTTGISIVSIPAGATNNSTPTLVDISNITVAASSSETIVFDVTVSGSANPGDTIDNTATITNPDGPGATPAAPTITVSPSQTAASGNKPLYLYTNLDLSRIQPGAQASVTINEGATASWTLTPALASPLTVDGSGPIPVTLVLGKVLGSDPGQNRDFTISLTSSDAGIGTFATLSLNNVDLEPDLTATYNLALANPGVDVILPAGSTLTLTIDNDSGGFGDYRFLVRPNGSFVNLPSKTVINVDSVQFYDAAYPGGSPITTTVPGTSVYIRAVVSDPFGSFDITSSTITILNPGGSPVVSGAPMTQVADSGVVTKTYEFPYTIPPSGADGAWTAQVTANEGTEGTISHQRNVSLLVSSASLTILKSVQTISDPIHGTTNPYNIPGAQMLYTIQVTNNGGGSTDTDTVVINDTIPANTALQVTDLGGVDSGPVLFIDGSPVSGLTYTFTSLGNLTDDLEFSTDGVDWSYVPTADANGADTNVRYIRINPKSAMLGNGGGGDPNFQIRFMVVVQ